MPMPAKVLPLRRHHRLMSQLTGLDALVKDLMNEIMKADPDGGLRRINGSSRRLVRRLKTADMGAEADMRQAVIVGPAILAIETATAEFLTAWKAVG